MSTRYNSRVTVSKARHNLSLAGQILTRAFALQIMAKIRKIQNLVQAVDQKPDYNLEWPNLDNKLLKASTWE